MVQLEDDKFLQELQISHLKVLGCFLIQSKRLAVFVVRPDMSLSKPVR